MKVALFTDTYLPEINGVAVATSALKDIFIKNGHQVIIVTTNPFSKKTIFKDGVLRIPGIKLKWLYDYRMAGIYNHKATKIVKKMNFDLIHIQTEIGIGIFGRIMAKSLNIPLVYTYHTMYVDYTYYFTKGKFDRLAKSVMRKFSKICAESCTEFTTPSNKTKDALRTYGVTRFINVIPNGLDLSRFDKSKIDEQRKKKFLKDHNLEDTTIFLYLGRVAHEKSIDFLVEGYAEFLKKAPKDRKTKLLIVGDGPSRPDLEKQVEELGIKENVLFLGKVPYDDVPFYYALGDFFLSASISETQGLTFIEAMAAKTLVICRFDENLVNVVLDGKTGYFFTDIHSYVMKLNYAMQMSAEQKEQMENAAYEHDKMFSIENYYQSMLEVYYRAIRKRW